MSEKDIKKAEKDKEKAAKKAEKEDAKRRKAEEKSLKAALKADKKKRKSHGVADAVDQTKSPADGADSSLPSPESTEPEVAPAPTEAASAEPTAEAPAAAVPASNAEAAPEPAPTQPEQAAAASAAEAPAAAVPASNAEAAPDSTAALAEPKAAPSETAAPAVTATPAPAPAPAPVEAPAPAPAPVEAPAEVVQRTSNIARTKSARRSVHGAPTQMAAGMKVMPTPVLPSSSENAAPEDALGSEMVEDECDEAVGAMASEDAMKTAEWLKSAVDVFKAKIAQLQTNLGYSQAYGAMQMLGRDQPAVNSQKEANKLKNRYGNIMAYDHSRVHLPQMGDDPDTTYINANWVDGYKQPKAYIASQGPVPNSFISFWRMIWHMKIETIVMVTHEVEKGKMKCHRYWPDPTSSPPVKRMQYGQITVSHLQSVPHKHFVVRTFDISFGDEVRTIKHFAYTSWPDHGVPLTTQELLGFRNAIHSSITTPSAPQVIHCSAGVGRTGTYIAIDRLMRSALDMGGPIDVDKVVQDMRMARNFMVQTEIQYMFIFRAVLDASLELLSGESTKAQAQEMAAEERAAYEKQQEEAAKEEEARKAKEQAEIEIARKELLARTDNSAAAAASIVTMSIAERVKLLQNAEARWLLAYRASMEEWSERNKFDAEEYDTSSALSPLDSRLEALQQKGLFDQANHS